MKRIALTGDKGGVGKSTISALLVQWFLYKDFSINVLDADPNRTISTWIEKCKSSGFDFCTINNPEVLIIDTAGTSGAGLIKHVRESDLIIIPFQPHIADLEIVVGWYLSVNSLIQKKTIFFPNRLEITNEQKEGIFQVDKIIQEQSNGIILPGLGNRPAVYPALLNALSQNYFSTLKNEKVLNELRSNFTIIEEQLFKG